MLNKGRFYDWHPRHWMQLECPENIITCSTIAAYHDVIKVPDLGRPVAIPIQITFNNLSDATDDESDFTDSRPVSQLSVSASNELGSKEQLCDLF